MNKIIKTFLVAMPCIASLTIFTLSTLKSIAVLETEVF